MAYLLRFDGVNDYVTLGSLVGGDFADRLDVNQEWVLEWRFQRAGSDGYVHRFFDNSSGGSEGILYRASDGLLRVNFIAGVLDFSGVSTSSTAPAVFRLVCYQGTNNYELFVDDGLGGGFISYGVRTASVKIFRFDVIGRNGTAGYINGDLYYVRYTTTNSGVNFDADSSASNGTGLTLPDTVGNNDGTLVNFPTDNSQWVFYSDGGATYTITLDSGSYSLSGQDVALLSNKLISLESGAYTYDGQNVDLFAGRSINLESGNYAYNGQDVNLLANRSISLEPANYTYTGQDVTLVYNPSGGPTYLLAIDAGAYNYSGQDTQLIANRTLSIDSGDYAYTGSNLSLRANRSISIDSGAYVVTSNAVVLSANRAITLESGDYAYTGSPVTLSYSGEVIALVSGYSVNYAQDDATATYIDDYIKARFI